MSEVVKLASPRKRKPREEVPEVKAYRAARQSARDRARRKRQLYSAGAAWSVALVLVGLSLSHLAYGVHLITGANTAESWSMAVGVDLGLIAAEVAILCAPNAKASREVARWAGGLIVGTSLLSAILNAVAFVSAAPSDSPYVQAAAAVLGACIPAAIFALTKLGYAQASHD